MCRNFFSATNDRFWRKKEVEMKVKKALAAAVLSLGMVSGPAVSSTESQQFSAPATIEEQIAHAESVIFFNKTVTTGKVGDQDFRNERQGTGFVYQDKYITVDHVVSVYFHAVETPVGSFLIPIAEKVEKTYIIIPGKGEFELKEIVNDQENDLAVFSLPPEVCEMGYCEKEYPLKLRKDLKVGDEVYWIGNPLLAGHHYRRSYISRVEDLPGEQQEWQNVAGLGTYVINGSSGAPVFDEKTGALVGVIQFGRGSSLGSLGYMRVLDVYKKYIDP